jgi:hypothetical protein
MSKVPAAPSQEASKLNAWWSVLILMFGLGGGFVGYIQSGHLVGGGIGFVVGLAFGFFYVRSRIRSRNQLKTWCHANGWTWFGGATPFKRGEIDFDRALRKSHIFWQSGMSEDATARDGSDVAAVVCTRARDRGKDNREYAGFLVLKYQGECPDITIEPRHLGEFISKIENVGEVLSEIGTLSKVEFESAAFNKKWRVHSVDAKAAYDRIDQSTIEFLNESKFTPAIEFVDGLLIVRVHHRIQTPEAHERLIRWVERFSAAVPHDLMAPVTLLPPARS